MNNDLFIQYSHSITWDYSKGILPSGREPAWDWEESYIPVEHKQGSRTLGKHEFMRVKVGIQGVWSVPMRIVGLGIKSVSTVLKSSSEGTKTYAIETTYDDGTVAESSSLLTIVDGKDGKDGADAENYDTASEWFDTTLDLQAFTGYSNDQYYGIFENKSIYQYKSGATVGIKPDDITGNGRYVLVSDLTSGFADDSDMDESPMVLSTKAVAPSNLQYWWDNVKTDYYTGDEVDTLLSDKVDKEAGKGLTSNDFTNTLKSKLDGIAAGAEVNVNADWDAVSGDAQILNKPSTFTPSAHSHVISDVTNLQDTLDDKLDKSLTLGKIWVGNSSNLPSEIYPDGLSGFVTVGTGGQYLTIKSAIDASKYNLVQVGDITENVTFSLNGNKIIFRGNNINTLTVTASITQSGGASSITFYDTIISASTNTVFVADGINFDLAVKVYNCTISTSVIFFNGGGTGHKFTLYSSLLTITSAATSILYCRTYAYNSKIILNGNRLYLYGTNDLELTGTVGEVNVHGSTCVGIWGSATNGGVIFNENNTYITEFNLPSLYVRSNVITYKVYAVNCNFLNIGTYVTGQLLNFTNTRFAQGDNMFTIVGSKSKFDNCYFGTALTLNSDVTLNSCETVGLTLSGTKNTVIGGQHTSIVVNGNSNEVSSCTSSTSITLGAVTKCKITNNETSTSIVEVLGNTFTGNTLA